MADGLMASNPMSGMPLQATPVGDDGVSGVLPSPPGAPTCSRVVLLGLDPATGAVAVVPHVLESAVASATCWARCRWRWRSATPSWPPAGRPARDGLVHRRGAAGREAARHRDFRSRRSARGCRPPCRPPTAGRLGPRVRLHRGASRYLGSVVQVAGRTVCSSVLPVGAVPSGPYGWALRCPVPGGSGGVVHVIGGAATDSVTVGLSPTGPPAGQQPYEGTSTGRPAATAGSPSPRCRSTRPASPAGPVRSGPPARAAGRRPSSCRCTCPDAVRTSRSAIVRSLCVRAGRCRLWPGRSGS